jgi:hypothetical protein
MEHIRDESIELLVAAARVEFSPGPATAAFKAELETYDPATQAVFFTLLPPLKSQKETTRIAVAYVTNVWTVEMRVQSALTLAEACEKQGPFTLVDMDTLLVGDRRKRVVVRVKEALTGCVSYRRR